MFIHITTAPIKRALQQHMYMYMYCTIHTNAQERSSKRTGLEELPREVHDEVEQRQCLHAVTERDEHEAAADGDERDGDQQVRLLVVPAAAQHGVRQGQGRLT